MIKFSKLFLCMSVTLGSAISLHAGGPDSDIFVYEDSKNAKNLTVRLKGKTNGDAVWQAREVKTEDIPFMQDLFADPVVMKGFAGGGARDKGATKKRMEESWIPRFAEGRPHGGLVVFDAEDKRMGHVVAGGGDGPGVSEIAYSYLTPYWGKGYGSSILGEIVETWGPTVRRIGLGEDPVHNSKEVVAAFTCFDEKILERFDATASPKNPGSWMILDKNDFHAAESNKKKTPVVVDFDGKEFESYQAMEDELVLLYDAAKQAQPFTPGVRYEMIDDKGHVRTFSYVERFKALKYHFERSVE